MTSAASISSRRTLVIRGRSADNRKAPLNFSFPLEGKCHVVAKGCTRVSIPMKLTIVLLGPVSADLETLCRVSTKRRILARKASDRNAINYQSAEPRRQALQTLEPSHRKVRQTSAAKRLSNRCPQKRAALTCSFLP